MSQFIPWNDLTDQPLSGTVVVTLGHISEPSPGHMLGYSIDGEPYAFVYFKDIDDRQNRLGTMYLDTTGFANGNHLISVVAEDDGIIDETHAVFSNVISNVFHNAVFDHESTNVSEVPRECTIRATITPPQSWSVEIRDNYAEQVLKRFGGSGSIIEVVWEGRDNNGEFVPPSDGYDVIIFLPDAGVEDNLGQVLVDGLG